MGNTLAKSFDEVLRKYGKHVSEATAADVIANATSVTRESQLLTELGISIVGSPSLQIFLTDRNKKVGKVRIENAGTDHLILIDNRHQERPSLHANVRIQGKNSQAFFVGLGNTNTNLSNLFMRSSYQTFFWGQAATAVNALIEIEGQGRSVVIGDDCMLSSQVGVRNYDMHTIFDAESDEIINQPPTDTSCFEQHVWVGHRSLTVRRT